MSKKSSMKPESMILYLFSSSSIPSPIATIERLKVVQIDLSPFGI